MRARQIWLTRQREWWYEFQPFAAVVTEFLHRGETRALPAMLGSSELGGKLSLVEPDDAVEIRNLRVAGPTPYEGGDVGVLLALFRTRTKDWMSRTLGAVEQIAKAVGVPSLIAAKPVADAVISAVTQFLGDENLDLRVAQYRTWSRAGDPGKPAPTDLQPMHYVVMRRPAREAGSDPAAGFSVRDGRLHRDGAPHTEDDFVLLSIEPRRLRDDYKSLAFYALWEQTQAHVVNGDLAAAERAWRRTAGALYSNELTAPQQHELFVEYEACYRKMLDRFEGESESPRAGGTPLAERLEIDDRDPAEILLAKQP